ncbi:MAG: YdhR family protein [Chloroflexota bacterium]
MMHLQKVVTFLLILGLVAPAFMMPEHVVLAQDSEEDVQLATAKASAEIVQEGRVLMHARTNRWVYDSVPPLGGPNEEVNPLDGMLSALIGCGMYIYEAVGIEEDIETNNLSATVQGEIDPRGVAGAPVNPRVRAFHVTINVDGPTPDQAAMMAESFSTRCPIYTTLALSADINVINVVDGEEQEPFSTTANPIVDKDIEGEEPELAMPGAAGQMMEFGRSLMSARGNRFINDSVPPINGPNEEVNPLDMFIGALPACGLMIYEAVARDEGIPLDYAKATVEADLDPRGVAGADVDPRVRAFRVNFELDGPTAEEAEMMAEHYAARCPIYTTFERSAPIEVTHTMMGEEEMSATEAVEAPALATAKATIDLTNQFGRALVSARGNYFIIDSAPPLGHPAQETNPVEAMLGAMATCGLFVYEAAANEMDIPLTAAEFTVQGDFNAKGLTGEEDVNPKVQQFRVHANLEGPNDDEIAILEEQYATRCPIYTTLVKAAPVVITHNDEEIGGPVAEGLATGTVVASLSNQPGRAILGVRENFLNIDSVPPLGGPNEEVNPMDLMLAAQGTCGTFIFEKAAMDMEIPFSGAAGMIEVDFDAQGLRDGSVDPAIQAMRVHWHVGTESNEEAEMLVQEWVNRCPIYNTLVEATEIDISYETMTAVANREAGAILEVDFTYDFETGEEYVAEVSPLADAYADVEGLVWKAWTHNEEEKRAGAVYLFVNPEARTAYLESELAAGIAAHPALSDFRIQEYSVMAAESMVTSAPVGGEIANHGEGIGTMLQINFSYNVSAEEYIAEVSPLAEQFAAAQGLRWKIWALDEENSQFSGILFFDTPEDATAFAESELAEAVMSHPALSDFVVTPYGILGEPSLATYAPVGTMGE